MYMFVEYDLKAYPRIENTMRERGGKVYNL